MKQANDKITMITAYDYHQQKLSEKANIDMILVGDSVWDGCSWMQFSC